MKKKSAYPLSVDCVVFGYDGKELKTALIERKNPPFQGKWALPGGFMEGDETVEAAALRELQEETGIDNLYLEQFHVFSNPNRDPRGRVITVAFFALVDSLQYTLKASEDASKARWWPTYDLPALAFDHQEVYEKALNALRNRLKLRPIMFDLLPQEFTLNALQKLQEQITHTKIDKRNFRKKIATSAYIKPLGKMTQGSPHRPAQLYGFDPAHFPE